MGLTLSKISGARGYFNMTKGFSTYVTGGLILNLDAGNSLSYPGTGTTWTDISGNGKNGTLINGVGYNSTNGGNLVFDGTNDYVSVPNLIRTGVGFTGTIEVITNSSGPLVHNERTSNNIGDGYFGVNSNKVYVGVDSNQFTPFSYSVTSTISGNAGAMNQYAASYTIPNTPSSTLSGVFCINGNFQNFSTPIQVSQAILQNFTTVDIGRFRNFTYGTTYCSAGFIAIVRIYNRQLSNAELLQNYVATKARYGI